MRNHSPGPQDTGTGSDHARRPEGRGTALEQLDLCDDALTVLAIARHYFASFACPQQQGWLAAMGTALQAYGDSRGPHVAVAVLSAVQAMRRARQSTFRFNSPGCPCCAGFASQHERAFLASLRATSEGRQDAAAGHAFLLCEGNDSAPFLSALVTLSEVVGLEGPSVPTPRLC